MKFPDQPGMPGAGYRPLPHAHYVGGVTDVGLGHSHVLELFTYPVTGSGTDGHTHAFQGITRLADNHFHRFNGITGPAIALPGGGHVHRVEFVVKDEPFVSKGNYYSTVLSIRRHVHRFSGVSGPGIGHDEGAWE